MVNVCPFHLPFALMQKEQKIRAVILFLETLENTSAPYPNSRTVLTEAELPIPELKHGCGGLPLISEFLINKIKAESWLTTSFKAFLI